MLGPLKTPTIVWLKYCDISSYHLISDNARLKLDLDNLNYELNKISKPAFNQNIVIRFFIIQLLLCKIEH